ncbi:hypothetical protein [Microvirga roseola]|uniref:hypothetical protein n=1 Tax=Microvirga roseola TaxID=2883126 RepID=UPI001E513E29|nr:hypothetical protein [Microvirga roseola]
MTSDLSFAHLRIKELEGRILARRRLAEGSPERDWHLSYVEAYEAEMQQLQAALREKGAATPTQSRSASHD